MTGASAADLLKRCEQAHSDGRDFPTIWHGILKPHPLVTGLPMHEIQDGKSFIVVRLLTGHRLASSPEGFRFI